MKEYIDREAAIKAALKALEGKITAFDAIDATEALEDAPAADVVEVVHGEWKFTYLGSRCSVCGYDNKNELITRIRNDSPYCPNCGAKMDGGKG